MESSADCSSQPPGSGALPSGMTPIFAGTGVCWLASLASSPIASWKARFAPSRSR